MSMIGKTLGHYQITSQIGKGGMGEVYQAKDQVLGRDVAIKVLPAGTLTDKASHTRLKKEARALSKLNHPNIEVLFELNSLDSVEFLVVEYIAGTTLNDILAKGAVTEKDIARWGAQLASGLAAAHEQQVVHCDIKPGNLRITADGRLKILDFGIAKLLNPGISLSSTDSTTDFSSSDHPSMVGTLPYMSPEQLRSESIDRRSDIYAAGAVLYEMATGARPFREDTTARLIDAILHQTTVPPRALNSKISAELERIILKCLAKDPENRYHRAEELEIDLRQLALPEATKAIPGRDRRTVFWMAIAALSAIIASAALLILLVLNIGGWRERLLRGGGIGRIESLVVLPLENLSNDHEQDYFAEGVTEELIANLGKIGPLRVISRTSSMIYKNVRKPLPQIASELKVDAVVEGTVLHFGNRVRITAQLIQAHPERNLWSESYERDMRDILAIQNEVALAIVGQIRIKLDPQQETRLLKARAMEPNAYEAYLKGRYYWNQRNREAVLTGLKCFKQAADLDPRYGLAYSGIADSYAIMGVNSWFSLIETLPKAKAAAQMALEIDDSLAEAHASMAEIKEFEWDWTGAEAEYKKALALNQNYASAHQWYSALLSLTGRHEEASREAKRALELDPLSPIINLNMGQILYFARQNNAAEQILLKIQEVSPEFYLAPHFLGLVYLQNHRFAKSIAALREADMLSHGDDMTQAALGFVYALAGKKRDSQQILEELKEQASNRFVSSFQIALVCVALGREDEAFGWLEKAYKQQDIALPSMAIEPMLDSLRLDMRFKSLLRRMNLQS